MTKKNTTTDTTTPEGLPVQKCTADLIGTSPFQFGKPIITPRRSKERPDQHEERTWRERMHVNSDGIVFIPRMALKLCLDEIAKFLSEKIPGKGNATYTKHFRAGIMVMEDMVLGVKADDVEPNRLFVPSDGKQGGGKRVWKFFPTLWTWKTHCDFIILDELLRGDTELVRRYLQEAGKFIGLGSFAPRNGGYFGRFNVENWHVSALV